MPKLSQWLNPFSKKNPATSWIGDFFGGTPQEVENVSRLLPEQEELFKNLQDSLNNQGAGGAYGPIADYYRDLLSPDSQAYDRFAAPGIRQYNEEIVPGISEQFAGMGSGGLSSSGFRNAQVSGATDLGERLASLRANLQQHGAQGFANLGAQGLGNYSYPLTTQQGSEGFASTIAPAVGTAAGAAIGGPAGAALGGLAGQLFSGIGQNKVAKNTSPYGTNQVRASPQLPSSSNGFGLPGRTF